MTSTRAMRGIHALELARGLAKVGSWHTLETFLKGPQPQSGLSPGKKYMRKASRSIFVTRWISSHSQSEVLEMIDKAIAIAERPKPKRHSNCHWAGCLPLDIDGVPRYQKERETWKN